MPELPEVETIKLGLQKIIGLKLTKIQILSPKSFIGDAAFAEGKKVLNVWRKAKILGIDLSSSKSLLIHLKMTGQLILKGLKRDRFIGGHPTPNMTNPMPNSHTRVIFKFSNNSNLYFNDQRKFGWIKLVDTKSILDNISLKNLGPEPLEKKFTWQILKQNLLRHKNMFVKVAIMDQSVVSGVGNIYASEACFNAKINPEIKVFKLSDTQFKDLYHGMIKSLQDGIKYGGSTKTNFVDAQGHKGYFLDYAYAYGRDKHSCKVCKSIIKKITLGGRGTYFCPLCQKIL